MNKHSIWDLNRYLSWKWIQALLKYHLGLWLLLFFYPSAHSQILCLVCWLPEYTEWPGFFYQQIFFFPDGIVVFRDDNAMIHWPRIVKVVLGAWDISGHHRVQTLNPLRVFPPIISTRSSQKQILEIPDRNECCDIAWWEAELCLTYQSSPKISALTLKFSWFDSF